MIQSSSFLAIMVAFIAPIIINQRSNSIRSETILVCCSLLWPWLTHQPTFYLWLQKILCQKWIDNCQSFPHIYYYSIIVTCKNETVERIIHEHNYLDQRACEHPSVCAYISMLVSSWSKVFVYLKEDAGSQH